MSWLAFICEPSHFFHLLTTECSPHTSWEFVMYMDYEYSILKGTRKFSWTSLVSSLSVSIKRFEVFMGQTASFMSDVAGAP